MASVDQPAKKFPRLDEDLLTCEVCTELIKCARILPCGHTFCQACLKKWAQTNQGRLRDLTCPTCREPWAVPVGGIEKLQVNYSINSIVGFVVANEEQDVGSGVEKCDFCEIKEAISACVECQQLACVICAKCHQRTKTTSDHQVVSIEDYKTNYENLSVELKSGECNQHPGSQLKFFCRTCSVPICSDCTTIEHRVPQHEHIYLREAVKDIRNSMNESLIKIKDKLKTFDEKETDVRFVKNKLTGNRDQAIVEVEKHTEDMLKKIQENRREMIRTINSTFELKVELFDSQLYKIERGKSQMKSFIEHFNRLLEPEIDVLEMMSVYKQTQERMKDLLDKDEMQVDSLQVAPYLHYSPDKGQIGGVISLPLMTVNSFGSAGNEPGQFKWPTGVAVLKDRKIVVADAGNSTVQVFDTNGRYMSRITINGLYPTVTDISITRGGILIMVDSQNKKVWACSIDSRLGKFAAIGELTWPFGVAVSSDGHVHVADCDGHCVKTFTLLGRLVRTIGSEGNQPGEFRHPRYIAVNSKDQIIVSDKDNHRVQVFDSSGTFLFTFGKRGRREGMLCRPLGVTVDQFDNIIVCDGGNDRIQMFSPEGGYIGRVDDPTDGVKRPISIATFPGQPLKLIVTEFQNKTNHCKLRILQVK